MTAGPITDAYALAATAGARIFTAVVDLGRPPEDVELRAIVSATFEAMSIVDDDVRALAMEGAALMIDTFRNQLADLKQSVHVAVAVIERSRSTLQ